MVFLQTDNLVGFFIIICYIVASLRSMKTRFGDTQSCFTRAPSESSQYLYRSNNVLLYFVCSLEFSVNEIRDFLPDSNRPF